MSLEVGGQAVLVASSVDAAPATAADKKTFKLHELRLSAATALDEANKVASFTLMSPH